MNGVVNSLAIIALAIVALRQQRALRRLHREVRALRRDHHDVHRWYGMLFGGLQRRPALISPANANEARIAQ